MICLIIMKLSQFNLEFPIDTVYQRTPDIAISEVGEWCEGNHTRSVFVQFSLAFHDFSANVCVSDFADILMYIYDCSK